MNLLGIIILVCLCIPIAFGSRRAALLAMMGGVLYLTQGVAIQIGGFNLFAMRILELVGIARVIGRREFSFSDLNKIDRAFILLYVYTTLIFVFRSSDDLAYYIGAAVDALSCYFIFRGLILEIDDLVWLLPSLLALLTPYVALLLIERVTHRNLFSILGAFTGDEWLREGKVRCFGSFRYASLLGTLGASFFPLYLAITFKKEQRKLGIFGIVLCLLIVWASNSGGPATAIVVGSMGWICWKLRLKMRMVRYGIVGAIVALALVMKAPVWYIFARFSALTGGDGWHRSYLIDMAIQHLDKWWLIGMPIKDTSDWFPYTIAATGGADMTNQFIAFGITAGLGSTILFIIFLKNVYSGLGTALSLTRQRSSSELDREYLLWGLGVVLTVHVVNLMGVTYFDQIYVIWFMQLACISSLVFSITQEVKDEEVTSTERSLNFQMAENGISQSASSLEI